MKSIMFWERKMKGTRDTKREDCKGHWLTVFWWFEGQDVEEKEDQKNGHEEFGWCYCTGNILWTELE